MRYRKTCGPGKNNSRLCSIFLSGLLPVLVFLLNIPLLDAGDGGRAPSLSISSVEVSEGSDGDAIFEFHLSEASNHVITVSWHTDEGTAVAGEDFEEAGGYLDFPAGQTVIKVPVPIIDDHRDESTEAFVVRGSILAKTTGSAAEGVATILDNDADVSTEVLLAQDEPTPGENVEFDLRYRNNGNHQLEGVRVTVDWPEELLNPRWTCLPSPGASCSMGFHEGPVNDEVVLPPGASVQYVYISTIEASATGTISLGASIDVQPSGFEPADSANPRALVSSRVYPKPDLVLELDDYADPIPEDGHFEYILSLSNNGPSTSTGGRIVDTLPSPLHFDSSTDGCYLTYDGIVCPFPRLEPGESVSLSFGVHGDMEEGVIVEDTARVECDQVDPLPENNTVRESTSLDPRPPYIQYILAYPGPAAISKCGETHGSPANLEVKFSEEMKNLPGNDESGDLDSPDSYRLIEAGADGAFETSSCSSPVFDDLGIGIADVAVKVDLVDILLDRYLPDGYYRLIVCASLADLADNPLDGNDDGSGGDDAVIDFRVSAGNLFENGHFDCSLDAWDLESTIPEEIEYSDRDRLDSEDSGSIHFRAINTRFEDGDTLGLSQCFQASSGTTFGLRGWIAVAGIEELKLRTFCSFFPMPDCRSESTGEVSETGVVTVSDGTWQPIAEFKTPQLPEGTQSLRCGFELAPPPGEDDFEAWMDSLEASSSNFGLLFADGFESGDLGSWDHIVIE